MRKNDFTPIIEPNALSLIKTVALQIAGDCDTSEIASNIDVNFSESQQFFSHLVSEADAVLNGDADAAQRLSIVLTSYSIKEQEPVFPIDDLLQIASHKQMEAIDQAQLTRLIAGAVRAAPNSAIASQMLNALGAVLAPLFQLERNYGLAIEALKNNPAPVHILSQIAGGWLEGFDGPKLPGGWKPGKWKPGGRFIPGQETVREPLRNYLVRPWSRSDLFITGDAPWSSKCALEAAIKIAQIQANGPQYTIDTITPDDSCQGQSIKLSGSNFGDKGEVEFASGERVTDARWSDTEIYLIVPDGAFSGMITLDIVQQVITVCGKPVTVNRLGTGKNFGGGLPKIYSVTIDGKSPGILNPGATTQIAVFSSAGPSTVVNLSLKIDDVIVRQAQHIGGGFHIFNIAVPDNDQPIMGELKVVVVNNCSNDVLIFPVAITYQPTVTIDFIEVTQGVQYGKAEQQNDLIVPTVAYKDTAVRVYFNVQRKRVAGYVLKPTGFLTLDNQTRRLPPINDGLTANLIVSSLEEETDSTLNFRIPAGWLSPGLHQLKFTIIIDEPGTSFTLTATQFWEWHVKRPMPVKIVWLDATAPGASSRMNAYAAAALSYMPTALNAVSVDSRILLLAKNYNLMTFDGWVELSDALDDIRDDDGGPDDMHWLGLVPDSGGPFDRVNGMARTPSNTCVARSNSFDSGAHELGHTYGLEHVHLPATGNNQPTAPDGKYDIVENGGYLLRPSFDVRTGMAISGEHEIMGYEYPRRFSVTNWMRLFQMKF